MKDFLNYVEDALKWIGSSRTKKYFLNANLNEETGYPYSRARFLVTLSKIEEGLLSNEMSLADTSWDISQYDVPQLFIDAMNVKKVWISLDFKDRKDKMIASGELLSETASFKSVLADAKKSKNDVTVMSPEEWKAFWSNYNENQRDKDHPEVVLMPVIRDYKVLTDFTGIRCNAQMYEVNKSGSISKELTVFAGVGLDERITPFLKSSSNVNEEEVKAWVIRTIRPDEDKKEKKFSSDSEKGKTEEITSE